MATNFLIALATALGSATLMLLVLYLFLKVFVPNSFIETISIPGHAVSRQTSETGRIPAVPTQQQVTDRITSSELFGVVHGDVQFANLFGRQSTQLIFLQERKTQKMEKEKQAKKNVPSFEEVLSPPGQSPLNLSTPAPKKSTVGVPNEALCGTAC